MGYVTHVPDPMKELKRQQRLEEAKVGASRVGWLVGW